MNMHPFPVDKQLGVVLSYKIVSCSVARLCHGHACGVTGKITTNQGGVLFFLPQASVKETFEKCSILFKFKEDEDFNHRNTFSISRIKI